MPLPSSFAEFLGNTAIVENLRAAVAAGRLPHSLILSGNRGAGKYTLALLLTMALECDLQPRELAADGRELADFCGHCPQCTRIAAAGDLEARTHEAVEAREELRDVDKREIRILIQTHPDVLVIPPDPPQRLIKLGQIRTAISRAQRRPAEAPARVFLLTAAAFMKEAANSLLKLLEEPPPYAYLILLAENTGELLPTIRSRCAVAHLGALPPVEIATLLAERNIGANATERELLARLAEGAVGQALAFDLQAYLAARADALVLLRSGGNDHTALFKTTETYRAGADGQAKTDVLLRAANALLEDMLLLTAGLPERIRNVDLQTPLQQLAAEHDLAWIETATRGLDTVRSGMRRNLLRNLSLDNFSAELEGARAF